MRSPLSIAAVVCALAGSVGGCRCEEPAPTESSVGAPPPSPVVVVEPVPEVVPAPPDGVDISVTLTRQLQRVAEPRTSPRGAVTAARCATGCALAGPTGEVVLVRPRFDGEGSSVPAAIDVTRFAGGEPETRAVVLDALTPAQIEAFEESGVDAPWIPVLADALGDLSAHRWAEDLVRMRARTLFSLDEYAPLVALGGAFEGRWLYAEVGETAYRIHLLRADRSVDRLVATYPLQPTACDGDATDSACVAPLAIDAVFASPDGRVLYVVAGHPAAGHGVATGLVLVLPLDDASVIPSAVTGPSRSADLVRSLSAPGPRARWWVQSGEEDEPEDTEIAGACVPACVRFRADGGSWTALPTRLAQGEARGYLLHRSEAPEAGGVEILPGSGEVAAALASALEGGPDQPARALVARQAVASFDGLAVVPLVELRAPHVARRLEASLEGDQVVLDWWGTDGPSEAARIPAHRIDERLVPASIVEVYAPPTAGFPLVVVLASPERLASASEGVAHVLDLVTIAGPPG